MYKGDLSFKELVLELRARSFTDAAFWIGFLILMSLFQWNEEVEGFQPIIPPHLEWMPGSNSRPGHQKEKVGGQITVKLQQSKQVVVSQNPTSTQSSTFVKDNKIDLESVYQEVVRRTSQFEDFSCLFERFKALATECGNINSDTVREAISALQLEAEGHVNNVSRINFGLPGVDFGADGPGNITHVEVKGLVGSAIKKAGGQRSSITRQGRNAGQRLCFQSYLWSNKTKVKELEGINLNASFPESPANIRNTVDLFDVPENEKAAMQRAVISGVQNDTNIDLVFLNNVTNI